MVEARNNRVLLLLCFCVYAISYIGKYSYSTNIQNVITEFSVSKEYAGIVTSTFFFCYGSGQLLNGILCEKFNSRWTISAALVGSAVITSSMFFLTNIILMAVLFAINGLFLSVLWCHCIKLLATIRAEGYMAKSATVMSFSVPVGLVAAYGCSTLFTYLGAWRGTYLFAAGMLCLIGILFFVIVGRIEKDTEAWEEVASSATQQAEGNIFQVFGLLVVPLLLIGIGTGIIRDGSSTWLPVLLSDIYALPDYFSILLTLTLPLMGAFTAMIAVRLIKKTKNVFGSALVASIFAVIVMSVLNFVFEDSLVLLIALLMLLSLAAYILGNTLTSILPLYYKGKLKSGQAAGLIDAFIYLGSAISTFFFGGIVDNWGWGAFMIIMFGCAFILSVMSLLGTVSKKKGKKIELKDKR